MGKYDDIIGLEHKQSTKRPRMPLADRAAQFSPFAALSGHGDAIRETARLTDRHIVFDEDAISFLDERLRFIAEHLPDSPEVIISHFVPDVRKDGGAYVDTVGRVKKIDLFEQVVQMTDGKRIPIENIVGIDGEVFRMLTSDP